MTVTATVPSAGRYWIRVRRVTWSLLGVWLAVTVALPWFARDLNVWVVGGFPLGYWMSAHGAILFFLLVLLIDVIVMERMDRLERAERVERTERQRLTLPSHPHA
jgi:putative solute:sodium symporter small subunit